MGWQKDKSPGPLLLALPVATAPGPFGFPIFICRAAHLGLGAVDTVSAGFFQNRMNGR